MTDRLHFTDSDEANALIASDPFALLVGFALDQQVTVMKAFTGPLVLKERLGTAQIAAVALAAAAVLLLILKLGIIPKLALFLAISFGLFVLLAYLEVPTLCQPDVLIHKN